MAASRRSSTPDGGDENLPKSGGAPHACAPGGMARHARKGHNMSDTATATRADAEQNASATTGRFIWYELMTTDQAAAIEFYETVVGWTATDQQMTDTAGSPYKILN